MTCRGSPARSFFRASSFDPSACPAAHEPGWMYPVPAIHLIADLQAGDVIVPAGDRQQAAIQRIRRHPHHRGRDVRHYSPDVRRLPADRHARCPHQLIEQPRRSVLGLRFDWRLLTGEEVGYLLGSHRFRNKRVTVNIQSLIVQGCQVFCFDALLGILGKA